MQTGMIGLGRMGANVVRRLMCAGHQCAVYDQSAPAVEALAKEGAAGAVSVDDFVARLTKPQYETNVADIAEVWRRGSVVASWLLDLAAMALIKQPDLKNFSGRVSDSGEGRWTITAAIDEGAPAPVLSAALCQRFAARGEDDFATRVLSAMRYKFGGHVERPAGG